MHSDACLPRQATPSGAQAPIARRVLCAVSKVRRQCAGMTTNVRDFGAVGDGRTDDSDAFLKAAAAVNPGGGVLYIPAGTFT